MDYASRREDDLRKARDDREAIKDLCIWIDIDVETAEALWHRLFDNSLEKMKQANEERKRQPGQA